MDLRLDHAYPLPLIVSDNWDPIKDAITEVYGVEYLPVSHGRGRPYSRSRFAVRPDLNYAQVVKVRDERGRVVRVERRIVYGDPVAIRSSLALAGMKNINTSYVERQNLSLRNASRRLVRKTICFSKDGEYLALYLEILQAWFNFVKLHGGLRMGDAGGKYVHRTPAMAQGLASGPMTWEEMLRWRSD